MIMTMSIPGQTSGYIIYWLNIFMVMDYF
jgi:hypothetical protein